MKLIRLLTIVFCLCFNCESEAEDAVCLIRDAEIEELLTDIAIPIFSAAKLNPKTAKIYVINSDVINAFTIGNGYIFINSGLILKFSNPLQLIGILCHETAHIAAGHVNRIIDKIIKSSTNMTVATVAGMIGAILTGSNELIALLISYAMTEQRFLMHYSREQELEADCLAASYLIKMGYDATALVDVFSYFERMEIISGTSHIPVYIRSHPKSIDRINAISKFNTSNKIIASKNLLKKYKRIRIKLKSYLKINNWLVKIPDDPYPKAIYLHRNGKSNEAIAILKKIIDDNPKEIYYQDTLAQILCETGKAKDAVEIYKTLCNRSSHSLMKIAYAKALLEANLNIDKAINLLESAKYTDEFNDEIFRLLAKAYGKKEKRGVAFFMLAREQMLRQNYEEARELMENAIKLMDPQKDAIHIKKAKYFLDIIKRDHVE